VAPSLGVACGAAVVGGVGNGIQWAPLVSAVQRLTPPSLHGRVMGALESIGAISPAIGLTLGGVLVALSTPRTAFLVVGVGAALTTIAFVRIPLGERPLEDSGHGSGSRRAREGRRRQRRTGRARPRITGLGCPLGVSAPLGRRLFGR